MANPKLEGAVLEHLNGKYTLESGEVVDGQSYSHLTSCLRYDGWKLPPYQLFVAELETLGFRIARGRGERYYAGGKRGLGVTCDVVTI
jgi:hypothetical protein